MGGGTSPPISDRKGRRFVYTLTQHEMFSDEIALQHNDGTAEMLAFSLRLSPETLKRFRGLQIRMIELQKECQTSPNDDTIKKVGECVCDLISLLFGQDNAERLISFYREDYNAMLTDLFPYIQNVLVPKLQAVAKDRKKMFKKNRNRRW